MRFILSFILLTSSAWAEMDMPQIQVQGKCERDVIPDRGFISFTAENQSRDQQEAVKKTTAQINKLKESLKTLKLSDVEFKNTDYSVHPVREWEKERLVNKGFRSSLTLKVTTSDISRLGEAMMKASDAGIINVGSLETFLSLKKSQGEYLKCLDIAAEDAKLKANQLAKKLGFKIGDVILLNETPQVEERQPVPMRGMMKSMALSEAAPTRVEAGTQKFATTILVTFKIK